MIIRVNPDSSITLDDPDSFTAFSVLAPSFDLPEIVNAFHGDAKAGEGEHVWISIARLQELGRHHGNAGWQEGCDGMLDFAASKGWVDSDRRWVRAHVEGA